MCQAGGLWAGAKAGRCELHHRVRVPGRGGHSGREAHGLLPGRPLSRGLRQADPSPHPISSHTDRSLRWLSPFVQIFFVFYFNSSEPFFPLTIIIIWT